MSRHHPAKRLATGTLTALAIAAASTQALAFDLNSDSPINVSADKARLDDGQGRAVYTGDVIVRQDATELTADKVVLIRTEGLLDRIEAFGQPAHYTQPKAGETAATDAEAEKITYSAGDNRILFENNAVIRQAGNVFKGERIDYDTAKRIVTAEGSRSGESNGRVEMVIQPNKVKSGKGDGN
ncbi:lipopolysaccharide transport periplasmic protein LptA [Marinobacter sp. 1Y8]